jgi:hypothetical protein
MKKILFALILLISGIGNLQSQSEYIVTYSTDTTFIPEKKDIMYKLFVEEKALETRHLWKMNFVDFGLLKPNLGFEQKLSKSWTTESYLQFGTLQNVINEDIIINVLVIEQEVKYYYNLNRRERLGKKTSGFSGNYIATGVWVISSNNLANLSSYNLGIRYGLQRRIGNIGYVEAYTGIYYSLNGDILHDSSWPNTTEIVIPIICSIRIGFAVDSFRIKRMIKY